MKHPILSQAALERDRFELVSPRRLMRCRWIAAGAVFDHFRRALQSRELAAAEDVLAIPLQPELEILVRIQAGGVRRELGHGMLLMTIGRPFAGSE